MSDLLVTAPIAFVVGVLVGLGLSSRYRIVRQRRGGDDEAPGTS